MGYIQVIRDSVLLCIPSRSLRNNIRAAEAVRSHLGKLHKIDSRIKVVYWPFFTDVKLVLPCTKAAPQGSWMTVVRHEKPGHRSHYTVRSSAPAWLNSQYRPVAEKCVVSKYLSAVLEHGAHALLMQPASLEACSDNYKASMMIGGIVSRVPSLR